MHANYSTTLLQSSTYGSAISACGRAEQLERAVRLRDEMVQRGFEMTLNIRLALLNAFAGECMPACLRFWRTAAGLGWLEGRLANMRCWSGGKEVETRQNWADKDNLLAKRARWLAAWYPFLVQRGGSCSRRGRR
jgi:pentatricopeptide repeat protein